MNPIFKTFSCSKCNCTLSYQENRNYLFKCFNCNRDYEVNNNKLIIRADLWNGDYKTQTQQTSDKSGVIGAWVITVLGVIAIFCYLMQFITDRHKSVSSNQNDSVKVAYVSPEMNQPNPTISQTPAVEPSAPTENKSDYELCQVHLVNTLQNTDKTGAFKAYMNGQTLTLTYLENPNEKIVINHLSGGLNNLQFVKNGQIEAEKTIYRRNDLEATPKTIIYTSRTEEITLTITY